MFANFGEACRENNTSKGADAFNWDRWQRHHLCGLCHTSSVKRRSLPLIERDDCRPALESVDHREAITESCRIQNVANIHVK